MKRIEIFENGIYFVLEIDDENRARLLHFRRCHLTKKR